MRLSSALRGLIARLLAVALVSLLTFVFVEGLSSAALFLYQLHSRDSLVTYNPPYMRYDPELGWSSTPNVSLPDMYGAGIALHTNSRGFRGKREVPDRAPPGKLRVVCSGDSFTMGHGVDDEHTWCHVLEQIDDRFETINMGQSGYGLDQAYLAFRRDGADLEPDLHLFAFIGQDVARMRSPTFLGYGRPLLTLRDGELVVENVRVPVRAWYVPPLAGVVPVVRGLRTFQLVSGMRARLSAVSEPAAESETTDLSLGIFEDLRRRAEATGGGLVIVYLPERDECLGGWPPGYRMGLQTKNAAIRAGHALIDLNPRCQELSSEEVEAMFIRRGEVVDPHAAGHYSVPGNERVAQEIHAALVRMPFVSTRLETMRPGS